jgi:hypothetical protein
LVVADDGGAVGKAARVLRKNDSQIQHDSSSLVIAWSVKGAARELM